MLTSDLHMYIYRRIYHIHMCAHTYNIYTHKNRLRDRERENKQKYVL